MMDRSEVLRLLSDLRTDEAVITTMSTTWQWPGFSRDDSLDLPVLGAMGQAPLVGLGVALAQPDRKVWILNGDGSQLMNLSSIATISNAGVKNVVLFLFGNGAYELTGSQPIPLAGRVDFSAVAAELGFANVRSFDEISILQSELADVLEEDGPTFVVLKVTSGSGLRPWWPDLPCEVRKFKQALGGRRLVAAGGSLR